MASSSGGPVDRLQQRKEPKMQVWTDSPHTFTEFGALSSDMKPSGNFLTRLLKRNKGEDQQSSQNGKTTAASISGSDSTSTTLENSPSSIISDTASTLSNPDKMSVLSDGASTTTGISRPESLANLQDAASVANSGLSKLEGSEEVLESQVTERPHPRTLVSVLTRLGSILDQRSTTPQTYKDSDFKQYWMPDSSCKECYDCGDKFTTFRRRHHCRICGQIFCSKCCNQELPGKIIGYKGGIRVCSYCCRVVQRYAQQSTTTGDFRALEDLRAISQWYTDVGSSEFMQNSPVSRPSFGMADDLSPQIRGGDQTPAEPASGASEMNTPFDLTPQSDFSSQESLLLESKLLIQDSVQLRELWRQVCDTEAGVETQTLRIRLRTYTNCIVGRELVDWLIKTDKAATRDQAMAIGQAMLYAGYLDCLGNQIPIFKDDFTLYRPGEAASSVDLLSVSESMPTIREELERNEPLWFQQIKQKGEDVEANELPPQEKTVRSVEASCEMESSGEKLEGEEEYVRETEPSGGSRGGSFSELPKINTLARDMIEEPLPRQDPSVHGLGEDFLKGAVFLGRPNVVTSIACPTGWRNVEQLREENGEKLAYERLKKAHTELWHSLTRQLLSANGLLLSWESVISSVITQVSHFVRPDVRTDGDDMDIRNYVHIKKVPGGQKNETSLFHGVIFSKNVAHKKMRTKITNPLILLLRGTIEFQRVENKFSSLEPQILQEREFMRNCVMKMVAYRPNVVVVEKSVSRLAQEFLLEAGITLLYNVKLSVMERLARFTQAHIVPSIDGLVSKPNMGFCHDFRVQTYNLPNKETKTLTFFDGCATHLGCTVVLSGGTLSELRRVKQIMKFMTYTAYNSLLELCFCMDEFALPQPGADEIGQPFDALESTASNATTAGPVASNSLLFPPNMRVSSGTGDKKQEEHPLTWSIKANELPSEVGALASYHPAPVGEEDMEEDGFGDEEDDERFVESMNSHLLEGEDRRQALGLSTESEMETSTETSGELRDTVTQQPGVTTDGAERTSTFISYLKPGEEEKEDTASADTGDEVFQDCHDQSQELDSSVEKEAADSDHQTMSVIAGGRVSTYFSDVKHSSSAEVPVISVSSSGKRADSSSDNFEVMQSNSSSSALPARDSLPVFQAKHIRHASDRSLEIRSVTGSQRATPVDPSFTSDEPLWDGTPKLVGKIMCIIPMSAMPHVPARASQANKEEPGSSNNPNKNKSKSTSGVLETKEEEEKGNENSDSVGVDTVDGQVISNVSTDAADGKMASPLSSSLATPQSDRPLKHPSVKQLSEMSGPSHPSTSKLTELTDGSDPLLSYQFSQDESIFKDDTTRVKLKEIKQTRYKRFRQALDGAQLSISPYHKYHVPFMVTDKGQKCAVRKYLPTNIFWSRLFDGAAEDDDEISEIDRSKKMVELDLKRRDRGMDSDGQLGGGPSNKILLPRSNVQLLHAHPLITTSITEPIWDLNIQTILADFRARGGRILVTEPTNGKWARLNTDLTVKKMEEPPLADQSGQIKTGPLWAKRMDCLDVSNHQRLTVLFSSYSYKSSNHPFPCVYPWIVSMDFYGKNDITLGGFLERFCFRMQYACPSPTCDAPMMDHIRRFVHGNACINVLLKHLDSEVPGARENILMWSWCRKCKQVTPVVPISSDTWSLSFAKYLDIRFHSSTFLRRGTAEPCTHSLHHDHFQYFGHRNIVASFKYATVSLKELALPATAVTLKPSTFDPEMLADLVTKITYVAMDRYSLMLESTMKLKVEMTSETQQRAISEFLAEQQADKKSFRDSATNIQMKIQELIFSVTVLVETGTTESDMSCHLFSIFDNIELLKRHIAEDVSKWNNKMQEFMASQQKKPRLPGKKDKDIGGNSVDELEKSLTKSSVKSNATNLSSGTPTSSIPKTATTAAAAAAPPPPPTASSVANLAEDPSSSSTISSTAVGTAVESATCSAVSTPSAMEDPNPPPVTSTSTQPGIFYIDVENSVQTDAVGMTVSEGQGQTTEVSGSSSAAQTDVISDNDAKSTDAPTPDDKNSKDISDTSPSSTDASAKQPPPPAIAMPTTITSSSTAPTSSAKPVPSATTASTTTTTASAKPALSVTQAPTATTSGTEATVGSSEGLVADRLIGHQISVTYTGGEMASQSQSATSAPVPTANSTADEESTDGWFQDLKGATKRWLSASSFTPLPSPFDVSEHHALPMCERVPITVNDFEPSSIVAYTLSSSDYLCRLREIQNAKRLGNGTTNSGTHQGRSRNKSGEYILAAGGFATEGGDAGKKPGVLSFLRGNSRESSPHAAANSGTAQQQRNIGGGAGSGAAAAAAVGAAVNIKKGQQKSINTPDAVRYVPAAADTGSFTVGSVEEGSFGMEDPSPSPEEKPKVGSSSSPSPHIEMQFSDATARFYCRVYFADQFRKLRKLILPGGENIFIRSLSRCKPWEAKGGKSGSSFSKTDDDRFILKQMSNMEVESFEKFGPQYFQYLKTCISDEQPTALAKILGVYRIGFRNSQTNHALRQDVLVMENLFYNRKISQKFDLKGSMRNRMVNTTSKRAEEELVLMDENLLKHSVESPLYMRPHSKHVLRAAITSDSTFLSQNLVMDYSLLVGLDEATHELVVGIIDYIRTFTWDKKLEMVVKSSGILGGQGKMPTVVSPQLYKSRFLEAMDRYFLNVPDHWMGLGRDYPTRSMRFDQNDQHRDFKKHLTST